MSFSNDIEIEETMQNIFGFSSFLNNAQKESVNAVLSGEKNVIVSMATHAGKSLCFQLTGALQKKGIILVISPNRSLIENQTNYLNKLNLGAVTINSDVEYGTRDIIEKDLCDENSSIKFFYLTPEMASTERYDEFLNDLLSNGIISHVVIDEAHCILDYTEFRATAFSRIKNVRLSHPSVAFIALTTASAGAIKNISESLGMVNAKTIKSTSVRYNIFYEAFCVDQREIDFLAYFKSLDPEMLESNEMPWENLSGIIYCIKIAELEGVFEKLQNLNIPSTFFHGEDENRFSNYNDWISNKKPIMVATRASFGLGIVKENLKFVIHLGVSTNLQAFYQESGRLDANGVKCRSTVFYGKGDPFRDWSLDEYIFSKECRRKILAKYFDEEVSDCTDMCDSCVRKD